MVKYILSIYRVYIYIYSPYIYYIPERETTWRERERERVSRRERERKDTRESSSLFTLRESIIEYDLCLRTERKKRYIC